MKKLLSLLTISTLATSIPAPSKQTKRDVNKTTLQLIRNKREGEETYEFTLSKARINWMWDGFRQNINISISEFDKNESGLNKLPIDFKNTLAMKNSYIYLDEEGISTIKTDNFGRKGDLKVTNIKGEIIKTHSFYNLLKFNFQPAGRDSADNLEWVKQQSQFNLVDSTKTMIWTRPVLIAVDGELNIAIANPNIDKVLFGNVLQPQTNKQWIINVKPETSAKDHNLQVFFTLDGKQYTSKITVSMLAKIETTINPVQKQLSELILKTNLDNILDNDDDNIFLAVNKANNSIIDDFTQITIEKKDDHSATLTAKPDSKSYQGSVDVKYNISSATVVDLKIDLQSTAPTTQVVKDYVGQIDPSTIINPVDTFYYANSESVITMIKPTPSSVISGVVYGCDEQWNKTPQSKPIDPTSGIKLDGSQLGAVSGKYLIELKNELGQTNTIYLQINDTKTKGAYWNTDKGKQFEQWAEENGYKNIRGYGASQLNNLFELSKAWKQSLKHLDLKLDNFVVENIKNVSQDEINTYKTKLLNTVKSQVEKYTPDVVVDTDYKILAANLIAGDLTSGKDVIVQSAVGSTKLLSFTAKTIPVQQKEQPVIPLSNTEKTSTPDNKRGDDSKLLIIGIVVGALTCVGVVYLLFRKFVFNKYILPKIYARRQQKVVEQWKRDDREEAEEQARKQAEREEQSNKNDDNKGGDE